MNGLEHARSFRELVVYQKSRLLAREIYMHTKFFPREELSFLTAQIRQSTRAMGADIIKAWAHHNEESCFISNLTDADAAQMETQHWIEIASDCGYMDPEASAQLVKRCAELGRILNEMIAKADMFCNLSPTVYEEIADYFIGTTSWSLPINSEQME